MNKNNMFYVVVTDIQHSDVHPIVHRLLFENGKVHGAENLSISIGRPSVQEFLNHIAVHEKGIWKQNPHVSWKRDVDIDTNIV